ncbi:MAG: pyridoxamine 5'-phosphate oxidase family protein, partial [Candidatus Binatia bacterium]
MAHRFAEIAFTDTVKALQEEHGSRAGYERMERSADADGTLGDRERQFIAARDSFYMASVGETGWPYIQHRGGPKGFLRVLDDRTLGFADFRGNLQYVSAGNFQGNDRVALLLMDYPNRRRLKILGRVRALDATKAPEPVAMLAPAGYPAQVERAIVIRVEAFDWNCP